MTEYIKQISMYVLDTVYFVYVYIKYTEGCEAST